jgi:glutamine synthetase
MIGYTAPSEQNGLMTMKDWIKQNQITEVECIIPDLAGAARGKIMPASKFVGSSALRMPQSVFMQSITRITRISGNSSIRSIST